MRLCYRAWCRNLEKSYCNGTLLDRIEENSFEMIHYNARPRSFQLLNIIKYFEHYWFSFSHFNSILLSHISTVHHHPDDSCLSCLIRAQSFILSLEWFMAHYFKRQANITNQFRDFLQPATIKHESLVTRKPAALWKTEKPVKL